MNSDACLAESQLREFALGRLSDAESSRIERHLSECPACEETVSALDHVADTVVRLLQSSERRSRYFGDVAYERALSRVQGLAEPPSVADPVDFEARLEAPTAGRWLRDYRLLEPLGRGGMGMVYRALHSRLDMPVAIKLLPQRRIPQPDAVSRFQREMRAIGKLDHPAIVRATDAGQIGDTHFLVMELIDGIDLAQLTRTCGTLDVADACEIVRQAALGIDHAHQQGIVHRDVKPSNLMLGAEGQVKILDMGLARFSGWHSGDESTTIGHLMGTLDYMAPEQCGNSHDVDARADIYGLGATLYKLLTGDPPYGGSTEQTPLQKLTAMATSPVTPIRQRNADLPEALSEVVHRALEKDPADRFASAADLAQALSGFANGHDLPGVCQKARAIIRERDGAPVTPEVASAPVGQEVSSSFAAVPSDQPGPREGQVAPAKAAGSGNRIGLMLTLGLAAAAAAMVFSAVLIYVETGKGGLTIECAAQDVQVRILRSDKLYKRMQLHYGPNTTRIGAGRYDVELIGATDGLKVEDGTFTLTRGQDWVAKVVHVDAPPGDAGRTLESTPPATAEATSEYRYEGRTYDAWKHELKTDRSLERRAEAVRALVALGKDDRGRETATMILRSFEIDDLAKVLADSKMSISALIARQFRELDPEGLAPALEETLAKGTSGPRYVALACVNNFVSAIGPDDAGREDMLARLRAAVILASRDPDSRVRARLFEYNVFDTLGGWEEPSIRSRLHELLDDDSPLVAYHAANQLVEKEPQQAELVTALERIISDPGNSENVRSDAIISLARLGPHRAKEVVPHLVRLMETDEPWLRSDDARNHTSRNVQIYLREATPRLRRAGNSPRTLQDGVIYALGQIGPAAKAAVPALEAECKRRSDNQRRTREQRGSFPPPRTESPTFVATALEKITGTQPSAQAASPDGRPMPRAAPPDRRLPVYEGRTFQQWWELAISRDNNDFAVEALVALRKETPQETLTQNLARLKERVRQEHSPSALAGIVNAMCAVATDETARDVCQVVLDAIRRLPPQDVRGQHQLVSKAREGLRRLNPTIVIPLLANELEGSSTSGRLFAVQQLESMSAQDLPPELSEKVTQTLLNASRDAEYRVRYAALRAATERAPNDEQVRRRLQEAISDEDPQIVFFATNWCARYQPEAADWLSAVTKHAKSTDFTLAQSFVDLLMERASLGDTEAFGALVELLEDPSFGRVIGETPAGDEMIRLRLMTQLGHLGSLAQPAVKVLERESKSENPQLRVVAQQALSMIEEATEKP